MNQILDHSGPKKKTQNNTNDIKKIIRVFSIIILIFGVSLMISGVYSVAKTSKIKKLASKAENIEPSIVAKKTDESKVSIDVNHRITLEKVEYNWDGTNAQTAKATANQTQISVKDIGIPTGDHKLNIKVIDIKGNTYNKSFSFSCAKGIDSINPEINIVIEKTRIEISAEDETELQFITYRLGNGNEETIYPDQSDKKKISKVLDLELAETTDIYVRAVDTSNNEATKQETIVVYPKPTIEFKGSQDSSEVYVTVKSTTPIKKINVNLNGTIQEVPTQGQTEYTFKVKVSRAGRNDITVEAFTEIEGEEVSQTASGYINYGG